MPRQDSLAKVYIESSMAPFIPAKDRIFDQQGDHVMGNFAFCQLHLEHFVPVEDPVLVGEQLLSPRRKLYEPKARALGDWVHWIIVFYHL